jgi:hypothetical protein
VHQNTKQNETESVSRSVKEFSRPEYWSRWPFPSPRELPNPRIKPRSPSLQADSYHLSQRVNFKTFKKLRSRLHGERLAYTSRGVVTAIGQEKSVTWLLPS